MSLRKDWAIRSDVIPVTMKLFDRMAGGANILEDPAIETVKLPFGGIKSDTAAFDDNDAGRKIGTLDYESISHWTLPSARMVAQRNTGN